MGAWESMIASLLQSEGQPDFSAGDSYKGGVEIADALSGAVLQNRQNYSTGEAMAGALITGLLGGAFEGASNDYQARQKKNYRDVLLGSFAGDVTKPEDMEQSLFEVGKTRGDVLGMLKESEDRSAEQQFARERLGKNLDALVGSEDPEQTVANMAIAQRLLPLRAGQ